LIALYRMSAYELSDQAAAGRSIIYLATFPSAFFFLSGYTEALYLLAAILALYTVAKERWWQAGLWGALASLARLPGALIVVPLVYAAWTDWPRTRSWRAWPAVVLTLIGAAVLPLYTWLGLHLPPWTPLVVQSARFNGGLAWPGANMLEAVRRIWVGQFFVADVLDLVFLTIFLVCAVPVWKKLSRPCGVYYAAILLTYLTRMGGAGPLLGTARYVLALFPAFILWGKRGERPWVNRLILYPS